MIHDLEEVRKNAIALMDELGRRHTGRPLRGLGWSFEFDRARRRMGACRWKRNGQFVKVVSVSMYFARLNGWTVMEDVVRHEIAHALDYENRGRSDHGAAWRRWAVLCGADPTRLYDGEVVEPRGSRYVGVCPSCSMQYPFHRRLKRRHACATCCNRHSGGRFDDRFELRLFVRSGR